MRWLLAVFLINFSFLMLHGQDDVLDHEVVYRNGKAYYQGKPLTGTVYSDDEAPNKCKCTLRASYAGGMLNGWKKEWYANGRPKFSGKFSHGRPVGMQVYYYESGKVKKKEKYVNGTLTERTLYYANGKPKKKEKYGNGTLISAVLYNRDGTPKGGVRTPKTATRKSVSKNQTQDQTVKTPANSGVSNVNITTSGEIDVNTLPDGLNRFFFADGKPKRVIVKSQGLLIKDSLFYPSGNLKKVLKYNFGELIHTEEYNKDGKLIIEHNFDNNKKQGIQIENFPDGSPHVREAYANGLLVRKEEFNRSGTLIKEENYSFGKPHGLQKKFDDSGHLLELKEYDAGRLIRFERYKEGQKQVLENISGDIYKVKIYDTEGRLTESGKLNIATDTKEGTWTYYNPQTEQKQKEEFYKHGKLSYFGAYSHNRKEGIWTYYSDDHQKEKRIHYKDGMAIDSTIIRYDLQIKKHYRNGDYILYHPVYSGHRKKEFILLRFKAVNNKSRQYIKNEILRAFKDNGFNKAEWNDEVKEEELRGILVFDTLKIHLRERNDRYITLISINTNFQDWKNGYEGTKKWVISPVTDNNPYLKNYYRLDKKKAFFETLRNVKPALDDFIDQKFPLEGLARTKAQQNNKVEQVYLNLNNSLVKYGDYFEVPEAGQGEVIIKVIETAPTFSVGSVVKGGERLKQLIDNNKKIVIRKYNGHEK